MELKIKDNIMDIRYLSGNGSTLTNIFKLVYDNKTVINIEWMQEISTNLCRNFPQVFELGRIAIDGDRDVIHNRILKVHESMLRLEIYFDQVQAN